MSLAGKKILIGVSGSIAAYKIALLLRLLKKAECDVKVIMTHSAKDFITPLTLSTLSDNPVLCDYFEAETGEWNNHVHLGLWADLFLIAPASANTLAKAANGLCDNLLLATYLSARCPVYFAPAMDLDMLAHPATQKNIDTLKSSGNIVIDPDSGPLASGLEGKGRMPEPETLFEILADHFKKKSDFKGKKILITAGPTIEPIDPVRYISNHSSGKMGYAIAKAFCYSGAEVHLISGPVHIRFNHPNLHLHQVQNAEEMYRKAIDIFPQTDIAILAAAVADYRPKHVAEQKIKKHKSEQMSIELIKNPDIAKELGNMKKDCQIVLGFALETEYPQENARKKLKSKNFDLIVINSPNDTDSGFGHDTNRISILDRNNNFRNPELNTKEKLAYEILESIRNFNK